MEFVYIILLCAIVLSGCIKRTKIKIDLPHPKKGLLAAEASETEAGLMLEAQAGLEVLTSRMEAAGFTVLPFGDEHSLGTVGALRFFEADDYYCEYCPGEPLMLELQEFVVLQMPSKRKPLVADWKRIGWFCVRCGRFHCTKRESRDGILGQILYKGVNLKDIFVALRESELDIPARIRAVIDAQTDYLRERISRLEQSNRRLLGSPSPEETKKD